MSTSQIQLRIENEQLGGVQSEAQKLKHITEQETKLKANIFGSCKIANEPGMLMHHVVR